MERDHRQRDADNDAVSENTVATSAASSDAKRIKKAPSDQAMAAARAVMVRHRDVLRELAK